MPGQNKNDRVKLEMQILRARHLAQGVDETTRQRLEALAKDLQEKLQALDD